jgi:hypothetical protein
MPPGPHLLAETKVGLHKSLRPDGTGSAIRRLPGHRVPAPVNESPGRTDRSCRLVATQRAPRSGSTHLSLGHRSTTQTGGWCASVGAMRPRPGRESWDRQRLAAWGRIVALAALTRKGDRVYRRLVRACCPSGVREGPVPGPAPRGGFVSSRPRKRVRERIQILRALGAPPDPGAHVPYGRPCPRDHDVAVEGDAAKLKRRRRFHRRRVGRRGGPNVSRATGRIRGGTAGRVGGARTPGHEEGDDGSGRRRDDGNPARVSGRGRHGGLQHNDGAPVRPNRATPAVTPVTDTSTDATTRASMLQSGRSSLTAQSDVASVGGGRALTPERIVRWLDREDRA